MFVIYELEGGTILDEFHGYVETEEEAKNYIRNKELSGEGRYLHYSEIIKLNQISPPKKIAISVLFSTYPSPSKKKSDSHMYAHSARFIPISVYEKEGEFPFIELENRYIVNRINLLINIKDYNSTDEAMKEKCMKIAEEKFNKKYETDQLFKSNVDDEIKKIKDINNLVDDINE